MKEEMKIHYCEQGSEEWDELRLGRMTASGSKCFLVDGKRKNGLGVGAMSYVYKKAAERITGQKSEWSGNDVTDRGHELEPLAIEAYEEKTYNVVDRIGFISLNDFVGCSPDGWIADMEKGVEVKCLTHPEHMRAVDNPSNDKINKDHIAQMQFSMFVTGAKEWVYVRYNPMFGEKKLLVNTIERDEKMISVFREKAKAFASEMDRLTAYMYQPETVA